MKRTVVFLLFLSTSYVQSVTGGIEHTINDVIKAVNDYNIALVHFTFQDIHGKPKEITLPQSRVPSALQNGLFFDGSSIEGYTTIQGSDLSLKPDPKTFFLSPWEVGGMRTARIFCSIHHADGTSYEHDTREILKQTIQRAEKLGYLCNIGIELEFFLFEKNKDGKIILSDSSGYCDTEDDFSLATIKYQLVQALEIIGSRPEKIHHEVAPSQQEISLHYKDALALADTLTYTKLLLKQLANMHGKAITFMPKSLEEANGNGMHIHFSLFDTKQEKNAFYQEGAPYHLSKVAHFAIGGILNRMEETGILFNSSINSYKRLVPGYEAPVYLCWGGKNRSATIRIPDASTDLIKNSDGGPVRIEIRTPDASCNIYLALSALICAALDGIETKKEPPSPIEKNLYLLPKNEREKQNIKTLATSLTEALSNFKKSPFALHILGPSLHAQYIKSKEKEIKAYTSQNNTHCPSEISPWEYATYW